MYGSNVVKYGKEISVKLTQSGYLNVKLEVTNVCGKSGNEVEKIWVLPKDGGQKVEVSIKFPKGGSVYW